MNGTGSDIVGLTSELCAFNTGVVAEDNPRFFARLAEELPLTLLRYPSGSTYNGWVVPELWKAQEATIRRDGRILFDGLAHPLGVAAYSRPFVGELELEEIDAHLVSDPGLPSAYMFHCMWQYRPWEADWALCMPHDLRRTLTPGRYQVRLRTSLGPGEMHVGVCEHPGETGQVVVLNAHTCHPGMANDDFAGVAVLVRLMQWLSGRRTRYTYRLVLGPEHLGTVFYLRDRTREELERMVCGVFLDMPGTDGPFKAASSFLGDQPVDRAMRCAAAACGARAVFTPWRKGAGNDETVWEAPGYEVPFVEVSRCLDLLDPFPEYHSSLDTAVRLNAANLAETYRILQSFVEVLENDLVAHRLFTGLVCLSNPRYDLYAERPDPAVRKDLARDSEKWGYLLDCLPRYCDGKTTVCEIALRHELPFPDLLAYLRRFEAKGLVRTAFAPVRRPPISRPCNDAEATP